MTVTARQLELRSFKLRRAVTVTKNAAGPCGGYAPPLQKPSEVDPLGPYFLNPKLCLVAMRANFQNGLVGLDALVSWSVSVSVGLVGRNGRKRSMSKRGIEAETFVEAERSLHIGLFSARPNQVRVTVSPNPNRVKIQAHLTTAQTSAKPWCLAEYE
jgi:hypothetical protein